MNKNFKAYALIWGIMLIVFNAVVFLVRPIIPGFDVHYDGRFWIVWAVIIVSFVGNLGCAYRAFRSRNAQITFYNIPLITISCSGVILMLVLSAILMLIPSFPSWAAATVCVLILAFNFIAVIKASWAAETVSAIDEKVKTRTQFVKTETIEAETLMNRAKNTTTKAQCKKVYEVLRYSEPMSSDAVASVEAQISAKMREFAGAVDSEDCEHLQLLADELTVLVKERNARCRALK